VMRGILRRRVRWRDLGCRLRRHHLGPRMRLRARRVIPPGHDNRILPREDLCHIVVICAVL
jgi:hypothetical protein